MGRAFVDAVAGRNHPLILGTDMARGLAVLPNGDPLWTLGSTGATNQTPIGSELPAGFDGVTHDWEVGFWFRTSSAAGAFAQNVYFAIANPITLANSVLRVAGSTALGANNFVVTQYQTNGSTAYRQVTVAPGIAQNTTTFISLTFPVGAAPVAYNNIVAASTSASGPTGTPMVVTGAHRFIMRPSDSTAGISKGYLFKRILSTAERARLYQSMLAA